MSTRRVFVIWTHPIFHESVRLLLDHPDVELVGATSDYATALNTILGLRPDTVLIEEPGSSVRTAVMEILETSPWNVRIVGLGLADNKLKVYQREDLMVVQAGDLLHLILGESPKG